MAVTVRLATQQLSVVPGQPASLLVYARNNASIVDAATIDVVGKAAAWATVVTPATELLPGAEAVFTLLFNPPGDGSVAAGDYVTGIRARLREDAQGSAVEELTISVGATGALRLEVVPRTIADGSVAEARISNASNVTQTVQLLCEDPEAALDVRAEPPSVSLTPGQTGRVHLHVDVRRRARRGETLSVPYRMIALGELGRAQFDGTATTSRRSLPLGRFLAGLSSAAIVAAIVAAGLFAWSQARSGTSVPDIRTMDASAAAALVQASGFRYAQRPQATENDADANKVLDEDPRPPARRAKGTTIIAFVGAPPAKAALPSLAGRTEADAIAALTGSGFFNVQLDHRQSDERKGIVVSTVPLAGGKPLKLDTSVLVVVSAGPAAKAIPDVAGRAEKDAVKALGDAGFTSVRAERRKDPKVAKDKVIGTVPTGQSDVSAPVVVLVSDGPENKAVPQLVGLDFDAAQAKLIADGFTLGDVKLAAGATAQVLAQDPKAGGSLAAGSPISVTVGQGTGTTLWTPPVIVDPRLIDRARLSTGITLATTTSK